MSQALEQLKTTLAALPTEERAALAHFLWDSLTPDQDIRAEWLAVSAERFEELESGRVQGVPADEVMKSLLDPDQ